MLNKADFDLIAGVLASERRNAVARGQVAAARQIDKTAMALADALSREHRAFDPATFMLGVCEATTPDGLPAPIRHGLVGSFGTSEPRRRPAPDPGLRPRELIDTSRWTEDMLIGAALNDVSRSHAASMAIHALSDYGDIDTLGELAAKTDEELQAIHRIGPSAMRVIREVLDLWRLVSTQHAAPSIPLAHPPAQAFPDLPRRDSRPASITESGSTPTAHQMRRSASR